MKRALCFIAAFCFSASWIAAPARASQISITGTADIGYASDDNFSISGPGLELVSNAADGPSTVSLCSGSLTRGCGQLIEANYGPQVPGIYSSGMLNGIMADFLIGSLTFSLAPGYPTTPIPLESSASGPVTFTGEITGVDLLPPSNFPGPPLFNILISGTGTLTEDTLLACGVPPCNPSSIGNVFEGFDFTFSGTATTTPEHATLGLLAIGLLGVGVLGMKNLAHPPQ